MAIIFVNIMQATTFIMIVLNIIAISWVYGIFNNYSESTNSIGPAINGVKNYIEIYLTGKTKPENVSIIESDTEISIKVDGDVDTIKTTSGTVVINGDATMVETVSGDVSADDIKGNVNTVSGDIDALLIYGEAKSVSGNIEKGE